MMYILLAVAGAVFLYTTFFRCRTIHDGANSGMKNGKQGSNLKNGFVLKNDTIYFKDEAVPYSDAATFEVVDDYYAKDKSSVYYYTSYRESKNYFTTSKKLIVPLKNALPISFLSLGYGYARDNKTAWYEGSPFEVAELKSMKVIDEHFVIDLKQAYVDRQAVVGSDGPSFELLDTYYAKDKEHVYYYLPDADGIYQATNLFCDTKSFKVIDGQYALDKDNVYFRGHKIPGADAASFSVLGNGFAKDNRSAYFETLKVKEADVFTFSVFKENELLNSGPYFAKDKQSVFANQQCFKNVDVFTFNVLNEKYSSDKNGVYYQLKKVKGAIPGSFKVYPHQMGDADAEDNGIKYFEGKKVE